MLVQRIFKNVLAKIEVSTTDNKYNLGKQNTLDGKVITGIYLAGTAKDPSNKTVVTEEFFLTIFDKHNSAVIDSLPSTFLQYSTDKNVPVFNLVDIDWEKSEIKYPANPASAGVVLLVVTYE